jgi:hypothetical protein
MRAVLPEPTGLVVLLVGGFIAGNKLTVLIRQWLCWGLIASPSNANCEGSLGPVSPLYDWHLPPDIASWSVQNLMRVAVFLGREAIMRMGCAAFVGVGVGHYGRRVGEIDYQNGSSISLAVPKRWSEEMEKRLEERGGG